MLLIGTAYGEGIPEPGLVMYGIVRNTAAGNIRQAQGTLHWSFQKPGGGTVVTTTSLTNINDQFSYVVHVPFETVMPGLTSGTNALALSVAPVVYPRSATVDGTVATFVTSSQSNFTFSVVDRGRMEQVDLNLAFTTPDTDQDGMPDAWMTNYFGHATGQEGDQSRAGDDADGDGLKNLAEYKAGTNPKDAQSCFEFIGVGQLAQGGMEVRWSSQPEKQYAVERSASVVSGFSTLFSNIVATPFTNIVVDTTATNVGLYFYRVRLQE
jgi:hypothetical protein